MVPAQEVKIIGRRRSPFAKGDDMVYVALAGVHRASGVTAVPVAASDEGAQSLRDAVSFGGLGFGQYPAA